MMPTVSERIALIVNSLDNYTYVRFLVTGSYGAAMHNGIVRDMPRNPGEQRRVTMTSTGSEWFVDAESFERMGITGLLVKQRSDEDYVTIIAA